MIGVGSLVVAARFFFLGDPACRCARACPSTQARARGKTGGTSRKGTAAIQQNWRAARKLEWNCFWRDIEPVVNAATRESLKEKCWTRTNASFIIQRGAKRKESQTGAGRRWQRWLKSAFHCIFTCIFFFSPCRFNSVFHFEPHRWHKRTWTLLAYRQWTTSLSQVLNLIAGSEERLCKSVSKPGGGRGVGIMK